MIINERNIRIDCALRSAVKIGALSDSDYDEACRLITEGEQAAAPVAPAAAAATDICRDSACSLIGTRHQYCMPVAQPDERAAFEAQWNVFLASGEHESDAYLMGWKVWQASRATAPQDMVQVPPGLSREEKRELILGVAQRTPIYQIGAPGIAGHQVVWWDVPQEEYERQKAAGYMRTGIVYREPS